MARVPCKHLLLLAFLFLNLFTSLSHGARSLGTVSGVVGVGFDHQKMKGQDDQVVKSPDENAGAPETYEDLVSVDYTPARRKPPIHN